MDVNQKKAAPVRVSKKWLARSLSVALIGAIVLPATIESNGALAATKATVRSTAKVAKVGKVVHPAVVRKSGTKARGIKRAPVKKATTRKSAVKKVATRKSAVKKAGTKKAGTKKASKKSAVTKPVSSKLKKAASLGAQSAAVAAGTVAGVAVSKNLTEKRSKSTGAKEVQTAPVGAGITKSLKAPKTSAAKPMKKLRMRRLHVMP